MKRILAAGLLLGISNQAFAGNTELLKALVEIDSGTSQIENVNRVQSLIEKELKSLGFETSLKTNPQGETKSGKLLVGTLKGQSTDTITFLVHADTVFEKSSNFNGLKIEGGVARGPGVIDDKGGIVVALSGLKKYLGEHKQPYNTFRFISSPSEETGSEGFIEDFRKFAEQSKLVLGFEPSLDDGSIVESRRGNRWFLIQTTGREAHAGRDHKKGINACLELAQKIAALSELTNYDKNVTVNIGHISGGQDKYNIVCGSAEAKFDLRFADTEQRDLVQKKIDAILSKAGVHSAADGSVAVTKTTRVNDCPPFSVNADSAKLISQYQDAVASTEKTRPKSAQSGGSADSNQFSFKGVIIIDGLGPTGSGMHTSQELLSVKSLETRSDALRAFLETQTH